MTNDNKIRIIVIMILLFCCKKLGLLNDNSDSDIIRFDLPDPVGFDAVQTSAKVQMCSEEYHERKFEEDCPK